ncbi:MAG: 50S ribosomal protein L23 [Candidatus Taylorbacteria bacterium]
MALFNFKKNKKTDEPLKKAKKGVAKQEKSVVLAEGEPKKERIVPSGSRPSVILRPRITEKASSIAEKGFYTFDVSALANKKNVMDDVARIYGVTPIQAHIVKIPRKKTFNRGKLGMRSGGKKAYVRLKEGDKIELV